MELRDLNCPGLAASFDDCLGIPGLVSCACRVIVKRQIEHSTFSVVSQIRENRLRVEITEHRDRVWLFRLVDHRKKVVLPFDNDRGTICGQDVLVQTKPALACIFFLDLVFKFASGILQGEKQDLATNLVRIDVETLRDDRDKALAIFSPDPHSQDLQANIHAPSHT